jgi:hypothetical protein
MFTAMSATHVGSDSICFRIFRSGSIIQLLPLYKGLNFLTAENLETGKAHPLFKINCHSAIDTAKLPIKLKLQLAPEV